MSHQINMEMWDFIGIQWDIMWIYLTKNVDIIIQTGWWFQTCFSIIYGMSSFPTDESYFSEGQVYHQPVMVYITISQLLKWVIAQLITIVYGRYNHHSPVSHEIPMNIPFIAYFTGAPSRVRVQLPNKKWLNSMVYGRYKI